MSAESSRRHFLRTAGLGAAGLSLGHLPAAAAAAPAPRAPDPVDQRRGVEVAIATIVLDGFGDEGYRHAFEVVPQIGIRNVEFNVWYPRTVTPQGIASIRERCAERGLRRLPAGLLLRRQRAQGRHPQALAHGTGAGAGVPAGQVHRRQARHGGRAG